MILPAAMFIFKYDINKPWAWMFNNIPTWKAYYKYANKWKLTCSQLKKEISYWLLFTQRSEFAETSKYGSLEEGCTFALCLERHTFTYYSNVCYIILVFHFSFSIHILFLIVRIYATWASKAESIHRGYHFVYFVFYLLVSRPNRIFVNIKKNKNIIWQLNIVPHWILNAEYR